MFRLPAKAMKQINACLVHSFFPLENKRCKLGSMFPGYLEGARPDEGTDKIVH